MEKIFVRPDGHLRIGQDSYRCALGRGGMAADKKEGDGATPVGEFPLRRLFYRADRLVPPVCGLRSVAIKPDDGWCDAPEDPDYNRLVPLPHATSHEKMWRDDPLYDLVVEIGYNDDPPVPGKGSAIFMHVARPEYQPTEGCVALAVEDLKAVLARCGPATRIRITE